MVCLLQLCLLRRVPRADAPRGGGGRARRPLHAVPHSQPCEPVWGWLPLPSGGAHRLAPPPAVRAARRRGAGGRHAHTPIVSAFSLRDVVAPCVSSFLPVETGGTRTPVGPAAPQRTTLNASAPWDHQHTHQRRLRTICQPFQGATCAPVSDRNRLGSDLRRLCEPAALGSRVLVTVNIFFLSVRPCSSGLKLCGDCKCTTTHLRQCLLVHRGRGSAVIRPDFVWLFVRVSACIAAVDHEGRGSCGGMLFCV